MKNKIEKIIKFYKRQEIRLKKDLEEMKEKDLSCHGYWQKGYYEGNLSRTEDIIDKLEQLKEKR